MKIYIKLVLLIFLLAFILGFVLPFLLSSSHTEFVMAAFGLMAVVPIIIFYSVKTIIKDFKKVNSEKN